MSSPTGTGKTICFTYMAKKATEKGNKTLILSDRTKLMQQNGGSFERFGLKPAYVNPKAKYVPMEANAVSGMLQTLRRRIEKPEWQEFIKTRDLIIIDECHLATSDYLFESGLIDHVPVIGASATSLRGGSQRQLGLNFDEIVQGEQVKYFVERGYLMPDRYFGIDCGDVSNVPFNYATGDYQNYGMYKHFDKRELYEGLIDNYKTHTNNTKSICFSSSQVHAIKTAVELNKAGISAMFLTSGMNMPKKPLDTQDNAKMVKYEQDLEAYMYMQQYKHLTGSYDDIISSFEKNKFKVLVNVNQLTTGIDIPDIETVIMNRYTISLQLYIQALGRGSRPSPNTGKIGFNILDFGNAAARKENNLGRYMDDRKWGLWHETGASNGLAGTKLCDPDLIDKNGRHGCGKLLHISMQICCKCGFVFQTEQELKEKRLEEIAYEGMPPEEVLLQNMNAKKLQAHAKLKGYKHSWLLRQLYLRGGKENLKKGLRELGYQTYYYIKVKKRAEEQGWPVIEQTKIE